jgi:UDP-N-acetyl-2-amino-2-deoxyglucuronate dehydrogenase
MTEKPMATRWQDGLAWCARATRPGAPFRREAEPPQRTLQLLKRAIEKSASARIYMVNINVFWTRPQEYYDSARGAARGNSTAARS